MANSTTNIDNIQSSQAGKEIVANAYFDASSPATTYGRRASTTGGLTWGFYGGNIMLNGSTTQIANGSLTLTASTTVYVEADPATGAVAQNNAGFTPGRVPLYTVFTEATTITSYTDNRTTRQHSKGLASIAISGAYTLTNGQSACDFVELTGSPSSAFTLLVPARPWEYLFNNGTGQSATITSGSGATVAIGAGKVAKVYVSASGIVRVTPDL